MKRYRFLLFDADKTLLDFDTDMLHAFQATYASCFGSQRPYSPALLEQYEACNDRWWKKLERGECTKPQLFAGRFQDFLQETGLTGQPEEINRLYFENLAQGGALLPGALELVRDLSGAYQLYIVTNGNAVSQMSRLERSACCPMCRTCSSRRTPARPSRTCATLITPFPASPVLKKSGPCSLETPSPRTCWAPKTRG